MRRCCGCTAPEDAIAEKCEAVFRPGLREDGKMDRRKVGRVGPRDEMLVAVDAFMRERSLPPPGSRIGLVPVPREFDKGG